jgi:HAD superfamily hydrolase (TIGR01662 family)
MIDLTGSFLSPDEIKKSKSPSIFPPTVLFKYRKEFIKPSKEEGFDQVNFHEFSRKDDPSFTNKALILDYDGCLRECKGGNGKYPVSEDQIEIKPNVSNKLKEFKNNGYLLLGISNQSGVHKGDLTYDKAEHLFNYTNKLLDVDIECKFCPHQSAPISCYCRKPQTGTFVYFMKKYKLSRKDCIFVGDMTTDKSFANRAGIKYYDQSEFFS